jgi:uncharacterized protein
MAVSSLWHWPSRRLHAPVPDVIRHTALRSSDFPPPAQKATGSGRPARLLNSFYSVGMSGFGDPCSLSLMRERAFAIAIGCASRALMTRDRLLRWPKKAPHDSTSLLPLRIRSGQSDLDAVFAKPSGKEPQAAVLICHGIGETVRHWEAAQRLLASEGVASLVFNYSGYARSTGRIHAGQFEHDAIAAFRTLEELLPSTPISLLGFSLGSGIATAIVTKVAAKRLVLCAAFTSFREAACRILPRPVAHLLPDLWNTLDALHTCTVPVLIVHGQADRLFPERMGCGLDSACAATHELVLVPELAHNDPIYRPQSSYWSFIATRVKGS